MATATTSATPSPPGRHHTASGQLHAVEATLTHASLDVTTTAPATAATPQEA
ncbi:hypothetical protein [Streptomyces sp. NBC_01304]|uniref:hypothetical protein n=1 Tax=Streptomyces sp. NBC_01304 TaxID=2903818 RepID=UPI002E128CF1|nr:hypothetical protein OG430_16850 [Streptomyces sp. NBC_01304]